MPWSGPEYFAFELSLVRGLIAEVSDRQAPAEYVVPADLELRLMLGGQVVPDRLEVTD